jgi:hypothetical protein
MNVLAFHNDINKALALIARKHGVAASSVVQSKTDKGAVFTVTAGESMSVAYKTYLQHVTDKSRFGHNAFKREYKGLCDEMLGREFTVLSKKYIYIGCMTSRPKYPVVMAHVDFTGKCNVHKGTKFFLDAMIKEYAPALEQSNRKMVEASLNRVDPSLVEGAVF